MVQKYDDDEEIVRVKAAPGEDMGAFENEGTTAMFYNKRDASLKSEKFTVLLELTGTEGSESDERPGLDIVIVLDVSGSMRGKNLEHMKTASNFVVKKLSPADRLSVVKFSSHAERLCPLTLMTQDAQSNIEGVIHALTAGGGTNMTVGLEEAVKVLNDRRFTEGRAAAIVFLSDGDPRRNMDGSQVDFGDIPVHTFGLGDDYDPMVLTSIAARSNGGTFNASDVDNPLTSNLSIAFAQCLGGLLSVVVKDLTMTITSINSKIEKVFAGNYPRSQDDLQGTVTIRFGNLYCRETRNILVNLVLNEVDKPKGTDILEFTYSYKRVVGENEYDVPPVTITVSRTITPSGQEIPEVLNESARQDTTEKMKGARILADNGHFDDAKGKLDEAKKDLERNELDQADPLIVGLLAEVKQFKKLMATPEIYEKLGRAFAFASELSHTLQRASARGDVGELRLFATKAMDQVIDQATKYEKNPNEYIVPTAADDLKERIVEQKEKEKSKKEEEAKGKLDEAKKDLKCNELEQSNPLIGGLLSGVEQLKNLMETPYIYEKRGRAFAYATGLSHAIQRAPAKGDTSEIRLFATKAMDQAIDQATKYEKNPNEYIVPTAADDLKERIAEQKEKEKSKKEEEAKGKLDEAKKDLKCNELEQSNPLIGGLLSGVEQLKNLMETPYIYEKRGRAFAYASELSHAIQRAPAKGDTSERRLFATKAMNQAIDQATKYVKNPNEYIAPTIDDDLKEIVGQNEEEEKKGDDLKNIPSGTIVEALSTHLDDIIKSFTAIKELLNTIC